MNFRKAVEVAFDKEMTLIMPEDLEWDEKIPNIYHDNVYPSFIVHPKTEDYQ